MLDTSLPLLTEPAASVAAGTLLLNRGDAVDRIKSHTDLPVVVGFGIKTAEDAADIGKHADGIVVGSVLVDAVARSLVDGKASDRTVGAVRDLVADLASGVKRARG